MSQNVFRDPIVSSSPVLTGTGNGTLTVDRLTHFTVAQDYTLTCIAKSPDTLFSVVGSLDGAVGIATVGTQFFDQDLKIFLTIVQGTTVFEVGDQFVLSVNNGTDLEQANIDTYDELPQKNFGAGLLGFNQGDHNLRYSDTALAAYLFLQDLKYVAATPGVSGDSISIKYTDTVPAVAASLTLQDLTFTAVTPGAAGNNISMEYENYTPAAKARVTIQDITYEAQLAGVAGNNLTVEYTTGAIAGSEIVTVLVDAITVQIQSGVSTANQIIAAVNGSIPAFAKLHAILFGTGSTAQTAPVSATNLTGGAAAIGDAGNEVVTVTVDAIKVKFETGVSTATQVKAALDAYGPATALISTAISGTGSNPQTAPEVPTFLENGADIIGDWGNESVDVTGSAITVYLAKNQSTATQVKAAIDASGPALALVSCSIIGSGAVAQTDFTPAKNLSGGKNKDYAFNHNESTDSGSFLEGNANVRVRDAELRGSLKVQGATRLEKELNLDDQTSGNLSGLAIANVQQHINRLIQDGKLALRTSDHSKVSWSIPDLSFSANILVEFPDTGVTNTILSSDSPVTLADGESVYVVLDREEDATVGALVTTNIPQHINVLRLATRYGDNIILWDNTLVRNGKSVRIGEGGEGTILHVHLYDPISTSLPSGATATIDGVAVANDMLVLFSNLSSGNNRVYKAGGVGTSITWTVQTVFSAGADPLTADQALVEQGTGFALAIGIFNGTTFSFNDSVRFFSGADYWELSSLKTADISDNTTDDIFTYNVSGSENAVVDYSLTRGTVKETGTLHITSDGTDVSITTTGAFIGSSGVEFSASVVTGVLHVSYTSDASGFSGSMKYFVRRWSDAAGGPGGPPSYSGGTGAGAAGSPTQIQFNTGGGLDADSDLTWDKTNNILGLGSMQFAALSSGVTLANNQISPAIAFSYSASSFRFATIEFSIVRGTAYLTGRMLIANDGTTASLSVDSVETSDPGITFTADISGGNVRVLYTSTNTGTSGTLKHTARRWN